MLSFHLEMQLFFFFFFFLSRWKMFSSEPSSDSSSLDSLKRGFDFQGVIFLKIFIFFSFPLTTVKNRDSALKILFALHALYEKSRKNKFGVYFWVVFVLKIISGSKEDNDFYFSYKRLFSRYSMTNWWIAYHLENKYEIWDPFSSGVVRATLNDLDIRILTFMFIGEVHAEICIKTLLPCLIRWVIYSLCVLHPLPPNRFS